MPNRRPRRFLWTLFFGAVYGLGSGLVSEPSKILSKSGIEYFVSLFPEMRKTDRVAVNLLRTTDTLFEDRWSA